MGMRLALNYLERVNGNVFNMDYLTIPTVLHHYMMHWWKMRTCVETSGSTWNMRYKTSHYMRYFNMQKRLTLLCREGGVHFTRISFHLSKHSSSGYTFLPSPCINFMALYIQTKQIKLTNFYANVVKAN